MFLLYDYVHIIKCIRNNWLTEKMGELQFVHNGETFIARWNDLRELFKLEQNKKNFVTLSNLNYVAVYPKPIERQSVAICLRVFCDKTVTALKTHSK